MTDDKKGTQFFIDSGSSSGGIKLQNTDVTLIEHEDGSITVSRKAQFGSANLLYKFGKGRTSANPLSQVLGGGGELLTITKQVATSNLDLWKLTLDNYSGLGATGTITGSEEGFAAIGPKTLLMEISGTRIYKGNYLATELNVADKTKTNLVGEATFSTDFNIGNPTVTGSFGNIDAGNGSFKTSNSGRPNMEIINDKIVNNVFTAQIKTQDSNVEQTTNGAVKGAFFSDRSAEMAGAGHFANSKTVTSFGFTAK